MLERLTPTERIAYILREAFDYAYTNRVKDRYMFGFGLGYGRHWGYGYGFGLDDYNNIQTVTEGSLIIDLVDRVRNEVVWTGTAVGEVTKKSLDHPDETLDRSVTEIFARYPVKGR